jgi:hypothetical protein
VATPAETRVVNAAGAAQGIVLVTFPAASTIFTSASEYDLSNTQYQVGYGIAAFGVGPLVDGGVALSTVYAASAAIAVVLGLLAFAVTSQRRAHSSPDAGAKLAASR